MSGAGAGRGEGGAQPGMELLIAPRVGRLPAMLGRERFSDLTVRLADGKAVAVNRILLAASSEVLQAKFEAPLRDADDREWAPEVGSAAAWEWVLGWMYGGGAPLPLGLFVEVVALADHFQMAALMDAFAALPIPDCATELVGQLLGGWACPQVLDRIAQDCVPKVTAKGAVEGQISQRLRSAALPNVALFIKFVPFISEMDRMRLIRALLRGRGSCPQEFPECFLEAVHWDFFPTEVLESGIAGNLQYHEELCGLPIPGTERTRGVFVSAVVRRSYRLEQQVPQQSMPLGPSGPIVKPLPTEPEDGLFAAMVKQGCSTKIELSSRYRGNDEPDGLFSRTPKTFFNRTGRQSLSNQPWIELRAQSLHVHPDGVGLLHGYLTHDVHRCQTFVVEASLDDGDWTNLLTCEQQPLGLEPTVLPIEAAKSAGKMFNRFRLRMTGPCTSNDWYLCAGWFEVFGTARAAVFQQLTQDDGLTEAPCP